MAVFKGFTLLKVRHYCSQKDYTWNKLSFKGASFTISPITGIPLPPLLPPLPQGQQGVGESRRQDNKRAATRPPAAPLSPRPPPSNLPPRSKAAQPGASTRNPHPELNDRHDARGAGGRREEEAGRGERHTRPRRALSAIRAPPPAGANTRGGRTAPGPRVAPPPPAAPPPPVSPHAMPL